MFPTQRRLGYLDFSQEINIYVDIGKFWFQCML